MSALALLVAVQMAAASNFVRVAVIDSGLDVSDPRFSGLLCARGHKDFTGEGLKDINGHGTHVAGLITKFAGTHNYCLVILKYYSDKATGHQRSLNFVEAIREARRLNVDFVNSSSGGPGYNSAEYYEISNASKIKFVVAAGNDAQDLDSPDYKYYPASYKLPNVYPVGCVDSDGVRCDSSNYGSAVKAREVGKDQYSTLPNGAYGSLTGTSMSAAVYTGKLVFKKTMALPKYTK